jgi:hypothetical protein
VIEQDQSHNFLLLRISESLEASLPLLPSAEASSGLFLVGDLSKSADTSGACPRYGHAFLDVKGLHSFGVVIDERNDAGPERLVVVDV